MQDKDQKYSYFLEHSYEGITYIEFENSIDIFLPVYEQVSQFYKEGFISSCNPSFMKMYGYSSQSEVLGKRLVELHGGDNIKENVNAFKSFIESDYNVLNVETLEVDKNGNKVYFLNNSVGVIENNRILGIWSAQIDITTRKKEEIQKEAIYKISQAVHSSENLNELYEQIHKIIDTIIPAKNLYIAIYDNKNNIIRFSYYKDESGFSITEKKPGKGLTEYVINTGKPLLATPDKFRELVSAGKVELLGEDSIDWLGVPLKKGKKTFGVLAVQSYDKKVRYKDEDKEILSFVSEQIAFSIDKKQTEEALILSESKYRNFVETGLEGVYYIEYSEPINTKKDIEEQALQMYNTGVLIECNDFHARMYGYKKKEDMTGKEMKEQYGYELSEENKRAFMEFAKSGYKIQNLETKEIDKNGNEKYFINNVVGVIENGYLIGNWGTQLDITERKKFERELIEAKEKAEELSNIKSNFLSNMSHELRTPLHGIMGFAQLLRETLDGENGEMADVIFKSGKRLMETLNLILNFSKAEAEKISINKKTVRIERLISEVYNLFEINAKQKGLQFEKTVKPKNLAIETDEKLLIDILNNIVNNAIKFTDTGSVTIEACARNKDLIIKVADTGIGISKHNKEIIFEEFRQESEGLSRSFEGTGLGLTISRKYTQSLGGEISLESELGKGSTFTLIFPNSIRKQETGIITAGEEQETGKEECSNQKIRNILVVENDIISIELLKAIVRKSAEIDFATDGIRALEKAREKKYDLILMDINLGEGLTGLEVTKKIRKLKDYKVTPIVAITAFAMDGDREEFLSAGCTHYLSKPFRKSEFIKLYNEL